MTLPFKVIMKYNTNAARIIAALILTAVLLCTAEKIDIPWDIEQLKMVPNSYPAEKFDNDGIEAVFFDGPYYKGGMTKIFAFIGKPDKLGGQSPGVVLVHGGGGTACKKWVRMWNERGYAAIAIDTTGSIPDGDFPLHKRHKNGGPDSSGRFDDIDEEITDQWTYHAVAGVILANSLLTSDLEVDRYNVGVVGVSWGGYLTCIAASIDDRFAFAVPIYGNGFLHKDSIWAPIFRKMGREKAEKWAKLWDPSSYFSLCDTPVLWVNGINDRFFPLSSAVRSCAAIEELELCIKPDLGHSHSEAFAVEEVYAFADSICKGEQSLVLLAAQSIENTTATVKYWPETRPAQAQMLFTGDSGPWSSRKWQSKPAQINHLTSEIFADIPPQAKVYFFNVKDERGLISSSPYRFAPK
jgi:dienelactone hydrolase